MSAAERLAALEAYAEETRKLLRAARSEIRPIVGETMALCLAIDKAIGPPACDCASPNGTLHDVGCSAYYPESVLEIGTKNQRQGADSPASATTDPSGEQDKARDAVTTAAPPLNAPLATPGAQSAPATHPEHTSSCAFNLPGAAPCDCGASYRSHAVGHVKAKAKSAFEALSWALDLLDMYDDRLIALGEPREKVLTPVHMTAKRMAWRGLSELRALCVSPPVKPPCPHGGIEYCPACAGDGEVMAFTGNTPCPECHSQCHAEEPKP